MYKRQVLPPKWSFGLWYSTGFKGNSEKNVEEDAKRFRSEKIPCDVMHFDCYWLREDKWCDFVWDEAQYPNRSAMIAGLKENGYKISLWINPYVTITTEMYQEGKEKGYFAKNKKGEPYEAVSYTHLDVYKRQDYSRICIHKYSVLSLDTQIVLRFHTKRTGRGGAD